VLHVHSHSGGVAAKAREQADDCSVFAHRFGNGCGALEGYDRWGPGVGPWWQGRAPDGAEKPGAALHASHSAALRGAGFELWVPWAVSAQE